MSAEFSWVDTATSSLPFPAERGNTMDVINSVLAARTEGALETVGELLSAGVNVAFSTTGMAAGREGALEKLALPRAFEMGRVTTSNVMAYTAGDRLTRVALTAHHLVADTVRGQLFPTVFGGKYVFLLSATTGRVLNISYVQEYQAENTAELADWVLAGNNRDYTSLRHFSGRAYLTSTRPLDGSEQAARAGLSAFAWAMDTSDSALLDEVTTDDVQVSRARPFGDPLVADKRGLDGYREDERAFFDLNQNSLVIDQLTPGDGGGFTISGRRLTPQRLGSKKLSAFTQHSSFFDERFSGELSRVDGHMRVRSLHFTRAAQIAPTRVRVINY